MSAPAQQPTAPGRPAISGLIVLAVACLVPSFMRHLSATVVLTDGFYAHGALMLARGHAPFTDFTQVAFPLAEGVLALALRLFGENVFVVEALNRLVLLGVAALLWAAGRRAGSGFSGGLAAILWSWCTWVVHFSLFERETWVALGTSLALLIYLAPAGGRAVDADAAETDVPRGRRLLVLAAALGLAFVFKITAVFFAAGMCLHLLLRRQLGACLRLGAAFSAVVVGATAVGALVWGRPFLWQVYVFGFFRHRRHDVGGALWTFAEHLDLPLLAGLVALGAFVLPRLRRPVGVLACVVFGDLVYMLLVSPTLWDHNLINLAPALALAGALWIDRGMAGLGWGRAALPLALLGALLLTALGKGWVEGRESKPLTNALGVEDGRERAWLNERASFVRRHSERDDVIACQEPWVAFEAGRVKFVRYFDLLPVALGIERSLAADGLGATLAKRHDALLLDAGRPAHDPRLDALADPYIRRLLANSLVHVRPRLLEALQRHEIALVVEPYLEGLGVLEPADLIAAGYERFEERDIAAWRPADGVVNAVVRPWHGDAATR